MENKPTNSFTYTQPYDESHVSHDISKMAMLFIDLMCQQAEANKSYGELIRSKDALAQFGFNNTKNAELLGEMSTQISEYKNAIDTLAFMESVWKKFGRDAMVVRYDQFFQILEKYDMVCGSFDRYLGCVPQFALDTLTRLNEMWERKELADEYANPFEWSNVFSIYNEHAAISSLKSHLRMPFMAAEHIVNKINDATGCEGDGFIKNPTPNNLSDVLFIAAPAADMQPIEMGVEFRTEKLEELRGAIPTTIPERREALQESLYMGFLSYTEYNRIEKEFFMAMEKRRREIRAAHKGVKDEENRLKEIIAASDINRYAKIKFIHKEPEIVRILKDPFICSLTTYGVLIHTKWGAEAEDATIRHYEQLRDAIMGGAK